MKRKLSLALLLAVVLAFGSLAFAAAGAVYTLNNSTTGNAVLVFTRTADGHISPTGVFPTGGGAKCSRADGPIALLFP